ncbi:hypothetical protein D3261_10640 [Halococcus sp. IIIV-5B]|nr:hypothetical protein D3261_10640 [Halococcus sp. IIIV-5B]
MYVESTEDFHERGLENLKKIEKGEPIEDKFTLSLSNLKELDRVFSEKNIQLLQVIAKQEPESIREAARLVERDVKEVHRNLKELEQLKVVEFESHGRSKKPVVWYDRIDVHVDLLDFDSEGRAEPSAV